MEYCAIESYGENKIPFYFSFISTTCFTQITQMEFFGKQFSLISLSRNFVFHWGNTIPQFPPIFSQFPTNFPQIPPISPWFHSFQYNFTSVHCLWALGLFYAYYMYPWKWGFHIMWDKEL